MAEKGEGNDELASGRMAAVYAPAGQPWSWGRIQETAAVDLRQERLYTSYPTFGTDETMKDSAMATVHSALTDLLDPLGDCMTPEVARKVVQLRSSADANSRMQLLAGKSTAGTLTDAEREEYDACVSAGTFIAILQAKARRMLGQNGAA
jgi:hypothetical protein